MTSSRDPGFLGLAALVAVACTGAGDRPSAETPTTPSSRALILSPADGDTVPPDVLVRLGAELVEVVPADGQRTPGRGHHHLFIDADPSPAGDPIPAGVPGVVHLGTGVSEYAIQGLTPGRHRIIAVLAYGDHVPMDGVATDTVHVVVR
jgi:hypothetical protein